MTTRNQIDEILATEGYKAAKAAADKAGILWFASAGATYTRSAPPQDSLTAALREGD